MTIISPPQFRDNLQDLLPALPNADEYFLLRWLRGEAGRVWGREGEREEGFQESGWDFGRQRYGVENIGSGITLLWAGI